MVRGYVPEHVWQVLADLSYFFYQLCAKELSRDVLAKLETGALVLLCMLEKIFPLGLFNPMQHMILHLQHEARLWDLCRTVGAIQLRGFKSFFEPHVKINAKLKLPWQRHTFCRRFQISQLNIILIAFLACIIHLLVTMLAKLNQTSAFFEDNSEVHLVGCPRPCFIESGTLS
jgi:hypothetical protein